MSLRTTVRRWLGREEQRALTGLPWDVGGLVGQKPVTPDQALSLVPVFGAVRLLASQIASLPLQTFRRVGDGRTRIGTPSLFVAPATSGTLYDWLHRCVTSLALRGNAYGLITGRDSYGFPTTVEWLHPDHVSCQDSAMSGPGSYIQPIWYWQGRVIPADQLVHIPWFTVPGKVLGLTPIEACAAAVSTGVSAQTYTSDWFSNGAVPPGKFKNTAKTVDQVEADAIKARLVTAIRSRKPLVYGSDWDYEPIAVSANEARFIETLKLNATQIAAIYGIPPEMLGGEAGGSLTYNTVEQNALNLSKFTLRSWLELLEESFSALLPRPQYVKFNLDALLRSDLTARMNAYQIARNIGVMNVDEIRALEDLPPLPDGKGQDYTPLLVQVAASRGIEAAEVKKPGAPLSDAVRGRPPIRVPAVTGRPVRGVDAVLDLYERAFEDAAAADDAGPKGPAARAFNPAEPRDPDGQWMHGAGVVASLVHETMKFAAGTLDVKSRDDGGVHVAIGDGGSYTDLSDEKAYRFAEVLSKVGGDYYLPKVGQMESFADYPPNDKNALPVGYAHIKRTGKDSFEVEFLHGDEPLTLTTAEAHSLSRTIERIGASRRVKTPHGPFETTLGKDGRISTTWPASDGRPARMDITLDQADKMVSAINEMVGATDEGSVDDNGKPIPGVLATAKVRMGDVDVTVTASGVYGKNGIVQFESPGWTLRVPVTDVEDIRDALRDGPVLAAAEPLNRPEEQ